jgi:tetratricopeptide (TPR) repeat protein
MRKILLIGAIIFNAVAELSAQSITLPPSGDNQKCSVTQWIGLASVNITYNSPNVTGPEGENRRGKIWGGVVPYGLIDNNFGTAKKMPWRAGANENTTISFSHDAIIEGQAIAAGTYGLHMIPGKEEWTVIFNNNANAWGSYFYDENEDALSVTVTPLKNSFTEWLTYDFITKESDHAIAALKWEDIMVPFKIEVDVNEIYLQKIRAELQSSPGFDWENWVSAINFCLQKNINLEEAALWANYAIEAPFVGEKNFSTLSAKTKVLFKLNKKDDAISALELALNDETATMRKIHFLGRELVNLGFPAEAMHVFKTNHNKHPSDNFTTMVGLGRGYEAIGKLKKAKKHYLVAADNAPEGQRQYYLQLADGLGK